MQQKDALIAELLRVFPQRHVVARAAPHECSECTEISAHLAGKSWNEIPRQTIAHNFDALPLLSPEAFHAFLPAWLREGLLEPNQGVAAMLPLNLLSYPLVANFTSEQAAAVVKVICEICSNNAYGPADPVSLEYVVEIERQWLRTAA